MPSRTPCDPERGTHLRTLGGDEAGEATGCQRQVIRDEDDNQNLQRQERREGVLSAMRSAIEGALRF